MYQFVDCEGFAGGFSVGATLAGLKLVGKCENSQGFGVAIMEANRAFLGDAWKTQMCDPDDWVPVKADAVLGNPPCSGFSLFSAGTSVGVGISSPINECMWQFHRYAAKVRPAVVIMESVGQAFSVGQTLMHELSEDLRRRSGLAYRTTHVLQDNFSVGGCTLRRRYFLINSIVPFGVERHIPTWLPTVGDALSDLRDLTIQWDPQRYQSPPTWWSAPLRSKTGFVDGHDVITAPNMARLAALQTDEVRWEPGDRESEMLKRYYERYGELPVEYRYQSHASHTRHLTRDKHLIDRGLETGGFGQTKYWDWQKPGRVITGHGPYQVRHPDNRSLTSRETARIMGYPDDWLCGTPEMRVNKQMNQGWGKGVSVAPAKWITTWIRNSLDGNPGSETGSLLPDGSHLIDVSAAWKDSARRLGLAEHFGLPVKPVKTIMLPKTAEAVRTEVAATVKADVEKQLSRKPRAPREPAASKPKPERKITTQRTEHPVLVGKCPGWEYDRRPTMGPPWDKQLLDQLVVIAQCILGTDARTGTVAALVNSAAFRAEHGAESQRGCASYHVAQARERLAAQGAPIPA
jgi:site-specific DNA-cytosine methylase